MTTSQPYILILDSSTQVSSVALSLGGVVLMQQTIVTERGEHSSTLAPMVERALLYLRESGVALSAVALSAGPGSYTGLRIGSSLAKGLCMGYDIPLIALSTLDLLVEGYRAKYPLLGADDRLCPMLDARRMEVYTAQYDGLAQRLQEDRALVLEPGLFPVEASADRCHFFGSGAAKCSGLWEGAYHIDSELVPDASYGAQLAFAAYEEAQFVDLAYWTPEYLKVYTAVVAKNKVLGR